jgi:hypothetical protein
VNCPSYEFCKEKFPENPSKHIQRLYQQCQEFRHDHASRYKGSGTPKGLHMQLALLCSVITAHHHWNTAQKNQQWPTRIDFSGLHERILGFKEEVWALLANDIVLHLATAWRSFLDMIELHTLLNTALLSFSYGPSG